MVRAYRVDVKSHCILNNGDRQFPATLENISADGALLTLESCRSHKLKTDEICNVMLDNNPESLSPKNTCRIARLDVHNKKKVAVQFIERIEDSSESVATVPYKHQLRLRAIYKGSSQTY